MEVSDSSGKPKSSGEGDPAKEVEAGPARLILKTQLKQLLARHGLSAAALSRKSGVPKQVLSLWLAGVEPRKLSHLKRVAQALGVSIDELCFGQRPAIDWITGVFEGRLRRMNKK